MLYFKKKIVLFKNFLKKTLKKYIENQRTLNKGLNSELKHLRLQALFCSKLVSDLSIFCFFLYFCNKKRPFLNGLNGGGWTRSTFNWVKPNNNWNVINELLAS